MEICLNFLPFTLARCFDLQIKHLDCIRCDAFPRFTNLAFESQSLNFFNFVYSLMPMLLLQTKQPIVSAEYVKVGKLH